MGEDSGGMPGGVAGYGDRVLLLHARDVGEKSELAGRLA